MTQLTPAQQRQQSNRTSDGKYTTKQHSEAHVNLVVAAHQDLQRERFDILTDGHSDQWVQDLTEHDLPAITDMAQRGASIEHPDDLGAINEGLKSIDLHMFYDHDRQAEDLIGTDARPELWIADKNGQTWAKLKDPHLLSGNPRHDVADAYSTPESLLAGEGFYGPMVDHYDYQKGGHAFVHTTTRHGLDSIDTPYSDPDSALHKGHPDGEQEALVIPAGSTIDDLEYGEAMVAQALQNHGVTVGVEYDKTLGVTELDEQLAGAPNPPCVVHFYRTDEHGLNRHFAMPFAKGGWDNASTVHGSEAMQVAFRDIGSVENMHELKDVQDWVDEQELEYDDASLSDPQYRKYATQYRAICDQRQELVKFFGSENLVDELATIA